MQGHPVVCWYRRREGWSALDIADQRPDIDVCSPFDGHPEEARARTLPIVGLYLHARAKKFCSLPL